MATFKQRLSEIGFDSYDAYLAGEHWQTFRVEYRQSNLPQFCLVCRSRAIQLHHCTYQNIGNESLSDVIPLCDDHHGQVHKICKHNRWPLSRSHDAIQVIGGVFFERPVKKVKPKKIRPSKHRIGVHQRANQLGMHVSRADVLAMSESDFDGLIKEVCRRSEEAAANRRKLKKHNARLRAYSNARRVGSLETIERALAMSDEEFDLFNREWQAVWLQQRNQIKVAHKAEYAKMIAATPIFIETQKLAKEIQSVCPARKDTHYLGDERIKRLREQARRAGIPLTIEQVYSLTPSQEQEIINLAQKKKRQKFKIALRR